MRLANTCVLQMQIRINYFKFLLQIWLLNWILNTFTFHVVNAQVHCMYFLKGLPVRVLKTFWIHVLVLFTYLAVISRRWQASRKRMWYPHYNIWTWSTTTRDSTSSPYRTNRLTPRTRQWRNGKYELTRSVCTGNPRTGARGASGERRRRQDFGWKYEKIAVITTELVAHDGPQVKWFGVWRRVLSCSSLARVENQYLANNEIIYMVYLFLMFIDMQK